MGNASEARFEVPTSRPFFVRIVTLNSVQANRVYRRSFAVFSQKVYSISMVGHIMNSEAATLIEHQVDELLATLNKELEGEKNRIDVLRANAAIDVLPKFDNPQNVEVAIKSPYDARFLAIILLLDEVVSRINSLWLMSEIKSTFNANEPYKLQQRVIKCANRVRSLSDSLRVKAKAHGHDVTALEDTDADREAAIALAGEAGDEQAEAAPSGLVESTGVKEKQVAVTKRKAQTTAPKAATG